MAGRQDRVVYSEHPLHNPHLIEPQRRVALAPHDPSRIGPPGHALPEEALLLLGELEAPHDPQEGAASVVRLSSS